MNQIPKQILVQSLNRDIFNGFSIIDTKSFGRCFLKHRSIKEEFESDIAYETAFNKAASSGLPTQEEKLASLIQSGDWSEANDKKIVSLEGLVEKLKQTKLKLAIKSQESDVEKQIVSTKNEIKILKLKKASLLYDTCEHFGDNAKEESIIKASLFKDSALTIKILSDEEYEYLEDEEIRELSIAYFQDIIRFTDENIKRVATNPLFYNLFVLLDINNGHELFNKSLKDITFVQQKLLFLARQLRKCIESSTQEIPSDIMLDYDKIISFVIGGAKTKKQNLPQDNEENVSDIKDSKDSLIKLLKEKGGNVTKTDVINHILGGK